MHQLLFHGACVAVLAPEWSVFLVSHVTKSQTVLTWTAEAKTPKKRSLQETSGSVLTAKDIKAATTQNLGRWWGRVQRELDQREAGAPEVKTPRGPKRPKVD